MQKETFKEFIATFLFFGILFGFAIAAFIQEFN